jgi:hypothetical protein
MNYWLDLFTGTTWDEFQKAGSRVSGFNSRMRNSVSRMEKGDTLLCYLTGVMRWVGALKVLGPSQDKREIWSNVDYPIRVDVEPLVLLKPEHGIPMDALEGKVDFYEGPQHKGKFKAFLRGSPAKFHRNSDGDLIIGLMRGAERSPVIRPVDPRKLARMPFFKAERKKGKQTVSAIVSVPGSEEETVEAIPRIGQEQIAPTTTTQHTEIQYHLLKLGSEMGLSVWVARNDRSKVWKGEALGSIKGMVTELPTQFNEVTNRTIELIDVLWLRGNSIVAAFEIECTTAIYSGLLRMSDLLALQPNIDIRLYLVAPDERRDKVEQELLRPTFTLRERPLNEICGFVSFASLLEKTEGIRKLGLAASIKPDFLEKTAEFFGKEAGGA